MKMKPVKLFGLIFILTILLSTTGTKVRAHPVDLYAQTLNVTFSQIGLQITWDVKPGPMLTSYLWYQVDADQDGTVTSLEADTWGSARAALLTATLDDKPLPLSMDSVELPVSLQEFQSGEEFITFTLSVKWPQNAPNAQQLFLNNELETQKSINWFYVSASENTAFLLPDQKNQTITIDIIIDRELLTDQGKLLSSWDSGTPALILGQQKDIVTATSEQVVPALAKNSPQEILLNLVRTENFSFLFYIFALGISLALGALHALTPGHGKTVVAAYLVGSRGTTWHAIALGSIVTLTHTGSVFLIGLFTLAASQYILPTSIIPVLEIVSGLMIIGLGLYLFWQRFQQWRGPAAETKKTIKNISTTKAKSPLRVQDKAHHHLHDANHHEHGHDHSHEIPETITWRSLVTLGISGGLVPCPDAIAILLVAIAINRILLGLTLIISFSLGLAVVLIVIGLLMVNSSRLFTRMDSFNKFAPVMPVVSAGIVLLLGFGLTYGAVTKLTGSKSPSIAATGQGSINEAQIIYLNTDETDHKQLLMVDTKGSEPRQLTNAARGVVDFAISPDQKQVAYFEQTEEIQYNLWIMKTDGTENRLAASCEEAECGRPVWSPDGKRVIYEHMAVSADGSTTGMSSLWWFDITTGEAQSVFQEDRLPGTNPRWSPNGEWLSYAASDGIRLYHLASGENRIIKNTLKVAAQWSPDSKSILLRDVIIKHDQFITQLFLYDLAAETITNLNPNESMENILAAWSPDGEFISVVRRDLANPRGDQIWIMRADGSDAHAITDAPAVLHGNLNWSPDGKYLLYDLYLLDTFPIESRLEMLNIKTGQIINPGAEGYNPKWVWNK